jgi:hypothetical protein
MRTLLIEIVINYLYENNQYLIQTKYYLKKNEKINVLKPA